MIRLQPAVEPRTRSDRPSRIGLAVAGGGPLGGIYELGVLLALEESLEGVTFVDLDAYVGVSSGAFIAASLANQLSPQQMARIFIHSEAPEHPFRPEMFLKLAFSEYGKRASRIPGVVWRALMEIAKRPLDLSLTGQLALLAELIPSGIFDNEELAAFLRDIYSVPGRTNDFRELERRLVIVAVDIDTGVAIRFGTEGLDHVPISRAVQASAALPGLYPPVEIDGHFFVDGALRRTLHASAALNEGVDLLIGLNPLVPYDGKRDDFSPKDSLTQGGLPTVLSQTFRAMIQSRMQVGVQKYSAQYPRADLMIVEPARDDTEMFFTNVFSYSSRHRLCEHAYQATRADLRSGKHRIAPLLARHNITLNTDVLAQSDRTFMTGIEEGSSNVLAAKLNRVLDDLESKIDGRRA